MRLAEANYNNSETGCCARLDRAHGDEPEFVWEEKPCVPECATALGKNTAVVFAEVA